ncbi:MAG: CoA pyrophosphatase [Spirochaetes bacterium]|nr:CoA pyrophosphatase [Spirochaetota bacterium]
MNYFDRVHELSDKVVFSDNKFKESAVLVPFIKVNNEENILFEIRSVNVPQPGEICFPGGNRKITDVSLKDTALRETCEELGISESLITKTIQLGNFHSSTGNYIHVFSGLIDFNYPDDMQINTDEVEKVFTIPVEFFISNEPEIYSVYSCISPEKDGAITFPSKELNLPEKYHQIWGYSEKKVAVYRTDYGIIWGITAQILSSIFSSIK